MSKRRQTILSGLDLNHIREGVSATATASPAVMPRASDYTKDVERQSGRLAGVLGADRAGELLKNENVLQLDPAKVRMWALADRDQETINPKDCCDLIQSMSAVGQVIPCIGRPVDGADHEVELIVGARRLFSAQRIAQDDPEFRLLAHVKPLDDLTAFKIMDAENRVREDISDWARATSYQRAIDTGQFRGREDLANTLGMPTAKLSKLLAFFDLPDQIRDAFPVKSSFRANWAYELLRGYRKVKQEAQARKAVFKKAALLQKWQTEKEPKHPITPEEAYRALLHEMERHILALAKESQKSSVLGYTKKYNGFRLAVSNKGRPSFVFEQQVSEEKLEQAAQALEEILGGEG
ncbi:ParB/RepB/Spo0J family partition protein [Lamprobacter modestohalophilus]|uniref:ParB/RepB/Spo0J family partition protein n=1 Tax=Lamprobacter modestohalophilus TaxID=1064514 RepID=UPI002ADECC25|nr:ParB/RepB/Spo0J family partition protein [Lamprobacter modestohalophilus]MEA1053120.1 ParB/RepB/Spo0J family partition protein [Lamprobacter modestohalophilus]